jgi:phenylalanyl-tRNA synthetase alpha chain
MHEKIDQIFKDIQSLSIKTRDDAESFRLRYLSKRGIIADLFTDFKTLPPDQKKLFGQSINELKKMALDKIDSFLSSEDIAISKKPDMDLTRPGEPRPLGSRHPVSIVRKEIIDIFSRVGFIISEGPEIEDDWHVFSALNFSQDHPARDMQDTFFIRMNPDILLRTHTSSVQVRVMQKQQPPIRTISPGRVFRNEAISARAHCIFHQVEGLYIDENVSFADLRQVLFYFSREMFGRETQIRLRPAFFFPIYRTFC